MAEREKVVLAYSGGLDTSICIKWLMDEHDMDVIAVVGEVGQEHEGLEAIRQKALKTGAIEAYVVDMREEFVNEYLTDAIRANALYENKYPLLSALSRPVISKHLVRIAHEHGAKYIAHGCTGKGNDQVRFETSVWLLDPSIKIIAPVREWPFKTRPEEIEWAAEHGVDVPVTNAKPYSIDDNLWGRAIECGVLEDPWNEPPEDIYTMSDSPEAAPDAPEYVEIDFEAGIPVALDGEKMSYIDIIYKLNEVAGRNGYGRLDMIENRLVGVKSRECYEQPAALALITAHKALEDMCLEREVLHYKLGIEQKWAEVVYYGQWFAPLKAALDGFINSTQTHVTGTVRCKFYKGTCTVVGRRSDYSVYDYALATYDKGDSFDHEASAGFIELFALPAKTWAENRQKNAGK
ncbi:MAG: argininosuccinate synthase [Eggerthellaceae bacterium]|nr:argininosuccinate synthase [Eggerthellaceae bacterium]